jgi:hypothetical protein
MMWEDQGLPAGGHFVRLVYNEPSQCLVTAFQQKLDENRWTEELYYRHRSSLQYVQVPGSSDQIHYGHVVTAAGAPLIFFNVTRWDAGGGDWESLSSFNLVSAELRAEVTAASFREPEFERVWISSVLSVRDDASSISCTVAFEEARARGNTKVHYWLCDMRLDNFAVTRIALLPNSFV